MSGFKPVGSTRMIEEAVSQWSGMCYKMEDKKFWLLYPKKLSWWRLGTRGLREGAEEGRCEYRVFNL